MKKFNEEGIKPKIQEITDKIEIVEIIDYVLDPETNELDESAIVGIHTDFSNKEIKRGDIIYITAIIKKKGDSATSPGSQAVLKVRITDIYNGFSILNTLK